MKFMHLFGFVVILIPLCSAASGGSTSELEQRDPLPVQADDAAAAVPDSQQIDTDCDNHLKIHRVHGKCDPKGSRGLRRSAHNCDGRNYFCHSFNTVTERNMDDSEDCGCPQERI